MEIFKKISSNLYEEKVRKGNSSRMVRHPVHNRWTQVLLSLRHQHLNILRGDPITLKRAFLVIEGKLILISATAVRYGGLPAFAARLEIQLGKPFLSDT